MFSEQVIQIGPIGLKNREIFRIEINKSKYFNAQLFKLEGDFLLINCTLKKISDKIILKRFTIISESNIRLGDNEQLCGTFIHKGVVKNLIATIY